MSSFTRRRYAPAVLALVSFSACAHGANAESERPGEDAVQEEILRMRKEQASLRKRVALLEDRLLQLDGGEVQGSTTTPGGRELPVVKLSPGGGAPPPVTRPAGRVQPEPEPARGPRVRPRQAVSLSPVPGSGLSYPNTHETGYTDDTAVSPAFAASDAPAAPAARTAGGTRSFRLTGSELVELTKTRGPKRPDRPPRTKKGNAILAAYHAAMSTYKKGSFAQAEAQFDDFARQHPRHDYADNALYWKGESAYDQEHYADALAAFTEVVERYGGGNKAPDALLKIGLCYGRLGDDGNARDVLSQLIAAYPRARATQIARDKLASFEE